MLHHREEGGGGELWARVSGRWEELKPAYTWDPPHPHLCWLSKGPLGPGHRLGKGHRTCKGVEFLDPANSGAYVTVSFVLQGTVV